MSQIPPLFMCHTYDTLHVTHAISSYFYFWLLIDSLLPETYNSPVKPWELGSWNLKRRFSPPPCDTCHMSRVMCHMSRITCHIFHVICHIYLSFYYYLFWVWVWVCYQWCLSPLVFTSVWDFKKMFGIWTFTLWF